MKTGETQAPVKKNDVVEIDIDAMGYDGEGIAHIGGYTVFIRYALPGERVRAVVIFCKPTFAVGKLLAVLRSSPERRDPFCPVYGQCGGCSLQHLAYEAQCKRKQEALVETFRKAGRLSVTPEAIVPSPDRTGYRNKMSLPVTGSPAVVGFYARGSHRVVPVSSCPIQFAGNGALIEAFQSFLRANGIAGYNETTYEGTVRHLAVRRLDGFLSVTVVLNGAYAAAIAPFDAVLRAMYGENYVLYANYNTTRGNRILGDKSECIGGTPRPVCVDGLRAEVHPHSFFQVNDGVRALLYREVSEEATGEDVIDAYSGAGVLSALLARKARTVTAVEIEPAATASARDLLARNGIANVRTICGDCREVLPELLRENRAQTVVLDPPRAGCDRAVLQALLRARVQKILYISCNPATLASNVAALTETGAYAVTRLLPFDMFPQTADLETLCVLSRKEQ